MPYSIKLIIKIILSAFTALLAFFMFAMGYSEKNFSENDDWDLVNAVIVSTDIVSGGKKSCLKTIIEYNKGGEVVVAELRIPRKCMRKAHEKIKEDYFLGRELFVKIVPGNHKMAVTKDYKNPRGDGYDLIVFSIVMAFLSLWLMFMPVKKMWGEGVKKP